MSPLDHETMGGWAARASLLSERIEGDFVRSAGEGGDRWAALVDRVAKGDPVTLERWLAFNGWTEREVREALSGVTLAPRAPLPSWTEPLPHLAARAAEAPSKWSQCERADMPFGPIYAPMIELARGRLLRCLTADTDTPAAIDLLPGAVESALESLWKTLDRLAGRALYLMLKTSAETSYRRFSLELLERGLCPVWEEYPLLARFCAVAVTSWVEATRELFTRLSADMPLLRRRFASLASERSLARVQGSLSDSHDHGRSVFILSFEGGARLVYKPRSLALEGATAAIVEHCNRRSGLLPLRVVEVFDRGDYGWVAYAEDRPCASAAEVERFYRRAGMWAALLFVLGSIDCHHENIVASGEHPLFIDLETALQPLLTIEDSSSTVAQANRKFVESVLRSGLLPSVERAPDGKSSSDASGLGGVGEDRAITTGRVWSGIGTDALRLQQGERRTLATARNAVMFEDRIVRPAEHVGSIRAGFEAMYRYLLADRASLLVPGGPIARLGQTRLRFVYRPTRSYFLTLESILFPPCLRDGGAASIPIEALSRGLLSPADRSAPWRLFELERAALARFDVPRLTSDADGLYLGSVDGDTPSPCFRESGLAMAERKLRSLHEVELSTQLELISSSLVEPVPFAPQVAGAERAPTANCPEPDCRDALRDAARRIGRALGSAAIRGADGGATWLGLGYDAAVNRFTPRPLGVDLYGGLGGVACFLAALAVVDGDREARELAEGALVPVCDLARDRDRVLAFARSAGLGIGTGLGSLVYSLLVTGRLLDSTALRSAGMELASSLDPSAAGPRPSLDLLSGHAGALVALTEIFQSTREPVWLTRAGAFANVLRGSDPGRDGGLAHGADGVQIALSRFEFARSGPTTWSPRRAPANGEGANSWCRGEAGILLGQSAVAREDWRAGALRACASVTISASPGGDSCCCGRSGALELLLRTADLAEGGERERLRAHARAEALTMTIEARADRGYQLLGRDPAPMLVPGFFRGVAGVGYELLRAAHPERLPSILSFCLE